jgi:ABC-2 type transport system permease protein
VTPEKPVAIRHPLVALTQARFIEFFREPGAIFWTFGFPLLLTVALGIAFRNQAPPRAAIAILEGPDAQVMAEALTGTTSVEAQVLGPAEAALRLRSGKVALVVVPGADHAVTYRFDASRPEAVAVRLAVDDALQRASGRADPRAVHDEKVAAPGARYVDWLVPGLLGMQLMSGSLWGIAYAIVQTRQRKLLKRLLATPMKKGHYLLSFLISRLAFVLVEVPVLLGFARLAFGVEVRGSLVAVGLVATLGAAAFAGLGLLCAARAQNTETANGLVNLVTLPMFVVSGVFFSSARFPPLLQPVIRFLPLTALNEALRALVNDGAALSQIPLQLMVLTAWMVVTFAVSLRIFRWT